MDSASRSVSAPITPYPYTPCQPRARELRFIEILPADREDETIECKLFHKALDEVDDFTALSYEWGDPSLDKVIIIMNKIPVAITPNLRHALTQLRKTSYLVVWIDALCINQQDENEKGAHLKLMKDIYYNASMVCAYIGPEADQSGRVMAVLRHVAESRAPNSAQSFEKPWTPGASELLPLKADLSAFFSRSYWQRVWIIQEIALSSGLRVFCGQSSVEWIAFEVLVPILSSLQQLHRNDFITVQYLDQMRLAQVQRTPPGLLQLLHSSQSAKATVPRDRVYGLLGLSVDGQDFVTEPRYGEGWKDPEVCLDITRTVIVKQRSLDIIFARTGRPADDLPSWCPDFFSYSKGHIWERIAAYIAGSDGNFRMGQKSARWTATSNSVVARQNVPLVGDRLLRARGFHLGTVDSIGCALLDPAKAMPRNTTEPQKKPQKKTAALKTKFTTDAARKKVFTDLTRVLNMYTRLAEETQVGAGLLYYYLFSFEQFYSDEKPAKYTTEIGKIQEWRHRNQDFMVRGVTLAKGAKSLSAWVQSGRKDELKDIISDATSTTAGMCSWPLLYFPATFTLIANKASKMPPDLEGALLSLSDLIDEGLRLFTTDSEYIGWAHPSTQLGDRIYLLHGCSMPVVLRPVQPVTNMPNAASSGINAGNNDGHTAGTFTVIGHALVDGAMDGALWSKLMREGQAELVTLQ